MKKLIILFCAIVSFGAFMHASDPVGQSSQEQFHRAASAPTQKASNFDLDLPACAQELPRGAPVKIGKGTGVCFGRSQVPITTGEVPENNKTKRPVVLPRQFKKNQALQVCIVRSTQDGATQTPEAEIVVKTTCDRHAGADEPVVNIDVSAQGVPVSCNAETQVDNSTEQIQSRPDTLLQTAEITTTESKVVERAPEAQQARAAVQRASSQTANPEVVAPGWYSMLRRYVLLEKKLATDEAEECQAQQEAAKIELVPVVSVDSSQAVVDQPVSRDVSVDTPVLSETVPTEFFITKNGAILSVMAGAAIVATLYVAYQQGYFDKFFKKNSSEIKKNLEIKKNDLVDIVTPSPVPPAMVGALVPTPVKAGVVTAPSKSSKGAGKRGCGKPTCHQCSGCKCKPQSVANR
jgi:hypothetical protein